MTELRISVVDGIDEVSAADWDACANPAIRFHEFARRYRDRLLKRIVSRAESAPAALSLSWIKRPLITHFYHMIFCRPWKTRTRSAAAPAGSRSMCWPERPTARWSPPRPAISKAIRAANMSSMPAGPRPMSAPAAATIRSSRSRCRSRRRPDAASWSATHPMPTPSATRSGAGLMQLCDGVRRLRRPCHLRHRSGIPPARRTRLSAAHRSAISLGESRLRQFRRFPRRADCAQAQDHPPRTPGRAGERHHRALAHRQRSHRRRLGRVLRILHGDRLAQMGPALSDPLVLFAGRRDNARPHRAGDGQARRTLDRRRHQFHRLAHLVRPPLGRRRASSVPAFRALLLSGDRLRDRAQAAARRSRRAGRTQDLARLHADDDLFGALHRRSGPAPRDRRLSGARTRLCRGRRHRTRDVWRRSARISPPSRIE